MAAKRLRTIVYHDVEVLGCEDDKVDKEDKEDKVEEGCEEGRGRRVASQSSHVTVFLDKLDYKIVAKHCMYEYLAIKSIYFAKFIVLFLLAWDILNK